MAKKQEARGKKQGATDAATVLGGGICRVCGGDVFTPSITTSVQEFAGVDENGEPFSHIVRGVTKCQGCGQARIVTSYENRV